MVRRQSGDSTTHHATATIAAVTVITIVDRTKNPPPSPPLHPPSLSDGDPNLRDFLLPPHHHQHQHHHHAAAPAAMLFPLHATLPRDGKRVTVSRVTDHHEITGVYVMIHDSARRGDGYGVDEFPTEKDFLKEVHTANGKIFQVCDYGCGSMIAAFVILESKYYRGQGPVMADSYTIVKREERRKGVGEFCTQMILEFARRLGYSGIYNDTFSDNTAMRAIIEHFGFQKVGFLPMSARMPDGSFKSSVIYFREFSSNDVDGGDGGSDGGSSSSGGGGGGGLSVQSSSSSSSSLLSYQSRQSAGNYPCPVTVKPPVRGDPALPSSSSSSSHQSQFAAMVAERGSSNLTVVGLKESDPLCVESDTLPS